MGKFRLLIPILLLVTVMVWVLPAFLKAMPDRYVARLPEPLQKLGLPEEQEAILPTAISPVGAEELLVKSKNRAEEPTMTPVSTLANNEVDPDIHVAAETETALTQEYGTVQPTIELTATPLPLPTPTPWPWPSSARLDGFQHIFQEWNNCGPATLAMALTFFDLNLSQTDTASILKPNPEDRNVSPREMAAYVNDHTDLQAVSRVNGTSENIRRLLANNMPVIVEVGIEPPGEFRWMGWYGHYLLIVAYDDSQEKFWVYDSWFGTSEEPLQNAHPDGRELSYADLEKYWPHFNRNYIVLYRQEQFENVTAILGEEMDERIMWENALKQVKDEVSEQPDNAFLWFNLGTAYNALSQFEDAATAFDQARAIGLPWRMLWYQFGPYEAYINTGRNDDVVLLADTTLKDRPYFEESYYYKGLALDALGYHQEARRNFEYAVDFNPNFVPAAQALSKLN